MYVRWWFEAFLLTLFIECPIVVWLLRSPARRWPRLLGLAVFANLATHPAVWFVFPALGLGYSGSVTLAELWAWGGEAAFWALVLPAVGWRRAAWASLCSNLASFGLGKLFFHPW